MQIIGFPTCARYIDQPYPCNLSDVSLSIFSTLLLESEEFEFSFSNSMSMLPMLLRRFRRSFYQRRISFSNFRLRCIIVYLTEGRERKIGVDLDLSVWNFICFKHSNDLAHLGPLFRVMIHASERD